MRTIGFAAGAARVLSSAVLIAGLGLAGPISSAGATPPRVPLSEAGVSQKAGFIQSLVTRSSAVKTIEASDDAEAKAALAEARVLVADAHKKLKAGLLKEANEGLDKALNLVNGEARRLTSKTSKVKRDEKTYKKTHATVLVFLTAFERVAGEEDNNQFVSQVDTIKALVHEAEAAAERGNMVEANVLIDEAYKSTRSDLVKMREGDVLTRSLNFETAKEEYDYELGRNESHFMLLKMAISKRAPKGSFAKRIDDLRAEAKAGRKEAEKVAARGDHEKAIEILNGSTRSLMKAVRMGGIFVPG